MESKRFSYFPSLDCLMHDFAKTWKIWVWSPLDFGPSRECNSMIREESFRLQQDMFGKNKYIQESHTAMENSPIF